MNGDSLTPRRNRRALLLALWMLDSSLTASAQTQKPADAFALKDGDRVVFYGDSITAQRMYTKMVEEITLSRYPKLHVRFYSAGVGGDRVTGGHAGTVDERLARDVFPLHPTVVTVMLGMNDGNYARGDAQQTAQAYEIGYRYLIHKLKSSLPDVRLYLIRPSPYDEIAHAPDVAGYNRTLISYGEIVKRLASEEGAQVIDGNLPLVEELERTEAINPVLAASIVPDRVHPSAMGAWGLATAIVEAWKLDPVVSQVVVDARTLQADAVGATATNIQSGPAGLLQWTTVERSLPIGLDVRDGSQQILFQITDIRRIDQELLRVTGLPESSYRLKIDESIVGAFSSAQLATGINLAEYFTPMTLASSSIGHVADDRTKIDTIRFTLLTRGSEVKDRNEGLLVLKEWDERCWKDEVAGMIPKSHVYKLELLTTPLSSAE